MYSVAEEKEKRIHDQKSTIANVSMFASTATSF